MRSYFCIQPHDKTCSMVWQSKQKAPARSLTQTTRCTTKMRGMSNTRWWKREGQGLQCGDVALTHTSGLHARCFCWNTHLCCTQPRAPSPEHFWGEEASHAHEFGAGGHVHALIFQSLHGIILILDKYYCSCDIHVGCGFSKSPGPDCIAQVLEQHLTEQEKERFL